MQRSLHAYIDESGQRGMSPKSSTHFVLSAVVFDEQDRDDFKREMKALKGGTGRLEDHEISFKRLSDVQRQYVSERLGQFGAATTIAIVIRKTDLTDELRNEQRLYLYTLRLLLERLSWLGKSRQAIVKYTISHITRLKMEQLRSYEDALRNTPTEIKWNFLDPKGGSLNVPGKIEQLQMADLFASSIGIAFNAPSETRPTDHSYLENVYSRLWAPSPGKIHSYGLKMFPPQQNVKAAYPEVATLQERCMSYANYGCPSVTSCRHTSVTHNGTK